MCAEAVLSGRLSDRPLGGLFGKFTTEEAVLHVLLVAKWQTNRSLQWPDLSSLDGRPQCPIYFSDTSNSFHLDETFCRFFDVAFSGVLLDGVILTPSSRAHLHALILQEEFDLTHEAAGPVEKIICAANVECHEMISMWYHVSSILMLKLLHCSLRTSRNWSRTSSTIRTKASSSFRSLPLSSSSRWARCSLRCSIKHSTNSYRCLVSHHQPDLS